MQNTKNTHTEIIYTTNTFITHNIHTHINTHPYIPHTEIYIPYTHNMYIYIPHTYHTHTAHSEAHTQDTHTLYTYTIHTPHIQKYTYITQK